MSKLIAQPFTYFLIIVLIAFSSTSKVKAFDNLTPEEIISKHLESIGTKEKRAEIKNLIIFSQVRMRAKNASYSATVNGKGVFFSSGEKNLWGFNLDSKMYPQDRFSFNGKETAAGFILPGVRSDLGEFILSNKALLRDGLLGGVLSTSWALLNNGLKNAKASYEGTKKIDGIERIVLSYSLKGSKEMEIKMYFDKQSYRHLRTEYIRVIGGGLGMFGIDSSTGQSANRFKVVENFSDFQSMGGLTLPGMYNLSYSHSTNVTLQSTELDFKVTSFSFNQQIEDSSFTIEGQ